MTDPCPTCVNGMVPVSGRGGDGFDPCPDCASPQPDSAPEGPWTAANPTSATLWPSLLNGAAATPAERAVIDADALFEGTLAEAHDWWASTIDEPAADTRVRVVAIDPGNQR